MFKINRGELESESKSATAKTDILRDNIKVFDAVKLVFLNLIDEITHLPVYNAVHWACNVDRWVANLRSENKTTYRRGEIVFLDLGAQNFRYEPSYTHACIVLADRRNSILIVPCSTKKYGSHYRDIINATPADGFMRNTGIQSESFRWVNKNRVVSQTGKFVSSSILEKLDLVLLSLAPAYKKEVAHLRAENEALKRRIAALERMEKFSEHDKNN